MESKPVRLSFAWAEVELFPSAPYSVCDASQACILGLALERQRGVHAIASDKRQDFDAWPGDLALASPDVNIFSESMHGGEYLALRVARHAAGMASLAAPRVIFPGDRRAVELGLRLRRLMLAPQPDTARIEEQLAMLLERGLALMAGPQATSSAYRRDRNAHARVLEFIEDTLDGPLELGELASLAGMPPLRFLRSFTHATGSTPHAYITERRLQRARSLLRATQTPLAAVALDCGFAHQSHLGAVFKSRLGLSPQQYRLASSTGADLTSPLHTSLRQAGKSPAR